MKIETQKHGATVIEIHTDFEIFHEAKVSLEALRGVENTIQLRYHIHVVVGKCFDIDRVERDCLRIMEAAGAEAAA